LSPHHHLNQKASAAADSDVKKKGDAEEDQDRLPLLRLLQRSPSPAVLNVGPSDVSNSPSYSHKKKGGGHRILLIHSPVITFAFYRCNLHAER
jgi:hypothetical protein